MGDETGDLQQIDIDHVWHPVLQHSTFAEEPLLMITGAEGSYIIDQDGKSYLDAAAGLWLVNIGYGRQEVVDAAYEQMKKLPYYPHTQANPPAAKLAAKLASMLPGSLNHIYFGNSGSEAVENALKIARQCARQMHPGQNRYKIIGRHRGYHGFTMGALSATGQMERSVKFEPLVPGFLHAKPPHCFRCDFGKSYPGCELECAREFEAIIEFERPESVAAVIAEPIIGGGGVIIPPDEYIPMLREICSRHGVLLILDEVITGFGRTGEPFASILYDVVPDLLTMAKGISSGYMPLGATAATDEVFQAFMGSPQDNIHYNSVSTFGGHAGACAAGLANLEILTEEKLWENAREIGAYLLESLQGLSKLPNVGEVRGKGLLIGIELIKDGKAPLSAGEMKLIRNKLMDESLILFAIPAPTYSVLGLSPPLILTRDEADTISETLEKVLTQFGRGDLG